MTSIELDTIDEALTAALAGLEWYRDRYPEATDGSDDEASALLTKALAIVHLAKRTEKYNEKVKNNLLEEIESLQKEIIYLNEQRLTLDQFQQTVFRHQKDEPDVWYWQGDGEDHLESMVDSLPVVITAGHLRSLISGK
jgi:hypothetical protein